MKSTCVLHRSGLSIALAATLSFSVSAVAEQNSAVPARPRHFSGAVSLPAVSPGMDHSHGHWQPLLNQPAFPEIVDPNTGVDHGAGGAAAPLLMTDGSVLVQDVGWYGADARVFKLTPDKHGSYVNGTWSELAPKPYVSSGGAQAVLADGRILLEGGEYSNYEEDFTLTNQGAIYDPVNDVWTSVAPPPFFVDLYPPRATYAPNPIGDSASVVLADGTFMLEDKMSHQSALLDLTTMTWTETGTATKYDLNDEEGLNLLPNGKVLTVDCYTDYAFGLIPQYPANPSNSEIYDPKSASWSGAGSTLQTLTDPILFETGPSVLRPNGKVFAVGSMGNSAIYDPGRHSWSTGPTLPISPQGSQYTVQDGPAALLPNGHVLFAASGGAANGSYSGPPVAFFEFDGKKLIPEPTIPNAANDVSGSISLLPLPNGQVLSVDSTLDVQIYTPADRTYEPEWKPVVRSVSSHLKRGHSYELDGRQLNGLSQACAFGDELQCATNYPLVRITNLDTHHVWYSRTHDHSSMGVARNHASSTHFDVPLAQEKGWSMLEVVANGIPSFPVRVKVE